VGLRQRRSFAQRVHRVRADRPTREGRHLNSWQALDDELDLWRASGRRADLWWRDDDACRDSPALARLLEVAATTKVPVALAVIPAFVEKSLVDRLQSAPEATILQHGYAHRNHAAPGERNWELGAHRPIEEVIAELRKGRSELDQRFDRRFLPVLVPPWNRIDSQVIAALPAAGFHGLSTFGVRPTVIPAANFVQCNTHIDLIAWRRGKVFIGREAALERIVTHLKARRDGNADPDEATGVLTHHLDFDDDAWQFMANLIARTKEHGGATWLPAQAVFHPVTSSRSA
jgi:peptidoglycan/xylan/chitin deacetylase (PgdA/CDA1 family)